jgi:hypothetical protein
MSCESAECKAVKKIVEELMNQKHIEFECNVFETSEILDICVSRPLLKKDLVLERWVGDVDISDEDINKIDEYLSR